MRFITRKISLNEIDEHMLDKNDNEYESILSDYLDKYEFVNEIIVLDKEQIKQALSDVSIDEICKLFGFKFNKRYLLIDGKTRLKTIKQKKKRKVYAKIMLINSIEDLIAVFVTLNWKDIRNNVEYRNKIIRKLKDLNLSKTSIAKIFKLSYPQICRILNIKPEKTETEKTEISTGSDIAFSPKMQYENRDASQFLNSNTINFKNGEFKLNDFYEAVENERKSKVVAKCTLCEKELKRDEVNRLFSYNFCLECFLFMKDIILLIIDKITDKLIEGYKLDEIKEKYYQKLEDKLNEII